jgi:hypothetical protein
MAESTPKAQAHKGRRRWRPRCRRCRKRIARIWAGTLDVTFMGWVLRVPIVALMAGLLVLSHAPQAQDLIVDLAPDTARVVFFLVLLIGWVGVTTYASILLLGTDGRLLAYAADLRNNDGRRFRAFECLRTAAPYVLGVLPFVLVLVATLRSYWNLPDIADSNFVGAVQWSLLWFAIWVLALFAIFVAFSVWCRELVAGLLGRSEAAAEWVDGFLPSRLSFRVEATGADLTTPSAHYFGPFLLVVTFLVSAIIFLFGPNTTAAWLPRALIIPVVLGGWLPLLTWLSGIGRRRRVPLISGGLLLLAVVSALVGDNHSVRRIATEEYSALPKNAPPDAPPPSYPAMTLNQAVDLWMAENQCDRDRSRCPRPIIVAGAGGASRAGFFTASVIGHLMDGARRYVATAYPDMDASAVRNRIFAISGVSGSAVGAVMAAAAMARGGPETKQPCAGGAVELWYGKVINNWRDCLEALMAGDFLTPVVLGLIFNDRISFGWWQDRATVIERSWEDHFAAVTGAAGNADWRDSCPGDLRCAFMTLRPSNGQWLPLLVLNGTSAATGRRIVTSILAANYIAPECPTRAPSVSAVETRDRADTRQTYGTEAVEGACLLFLETMRFHGLLANSLEPNLWTRIQLWLRSDYWREHLGLFGKPRVLNDVRLSTAAHNSARFPLISPPGAVRNLEHQVIDRIVDGGYIENYGALTALELAQAVHAIRPELAPFVLAVSNDPDADPDLNPLDAPDAAFLSDIFIPIEAILSARTGHGRLALGQVEAVLDHLATAACGAQTGHVRVWPQIEVWNDDKKTSRPVSMSWWLSKPIQIHLHQQTEGDKVKDTNVRDLGKVWIALDKPPGCVGRPTSPSTVETQQRLKSAP